ncbi:hypothetical protein [Oceanobacillus sp. CAU 1775]
MGYILPVERYQYNDYHIRDLKGPTDIEAVERPFKTFLEKQHGEIVHEYNRLNPSAYKMTPLHPQVTSVNPMIYAELTGKGQEINETI